MRVVIAGGGTGGHVTPALAVADQLRLDDPVGDVLFVGAEGGLEVRMVPARGYRLETLSVGRLKGARWASRLRTVAGLPIAVLRALAILRSFRPDVVVGVGGYASAPLVAAATLRRVPVVLLEQNAIPGLTNRTLAHLATRVVVSFACSASAFPNGRAVHLGNPLPPALVTALGAPRAARPPRCVLVLGGSQGAHRVNELVTEAATDLCARLGELRIIHQTGSSDRDWVQEHYEGSGIDARVEAFIDDTAAAYGDADFVIARAGATTLAELAVAGLPALLIPYPHAADDHQVANARFFVDAGAALMMPQEQATAASLTSEVGDLLCDPARLASMGEAIRHQGRPDAASATVRLFAELTASN